MPGLASFLKLASSGPLYTISSKPGPGLFKPGYPREPQGFGEWLRRLRLDHGMLIKDFARLVGVSEDTVINWEMRGRKPSERSREKLTEALRRVFGKELGW